MRVTDASADTRIVHGSMVVVVVPVVLLCGCVGCFYKRRCADCFVFYWVFT